MSEISIDYNNLPENVMVGQPVHKLHLTQHVGTIAKRGIHLQNHYLPSSAVSHLQKQVHRVVRSR